MAFKSDQWSCHTECGNRTNCNWSTYQENTNICLLTNDCPVMDKTCLECRSTQLGCLDDKINDYKGTITQQYSNIFY